MVRVWISPEGEWIRYTARNDADHYELAAQIAEERYGARIKRDEYGQPYTALGELDPATVLLRNGWVRYSSGNVEGQPSAIARNWPIIRDLAGSDVIRYGMNQRSFFDIWDDQERVRDFEVPLGVVANSPQPPAGVFREPSVVQQYRGFDRRPLEVRVRGHERRVK